MRSLSRVAGFFLLASVLAVVSEAQDNGDLMSQLARFGSRSPGTDGHLSSQTLLLAAMEAVGLRDVRRTPPAGPGGWSHLQGTLRGESDHEIVLTAHYDTVAENWGDLDNASGCAATMGVVAELSRVPLRNTIQVVLTDGEEEQAGGSRAWLSGLPPEARRRMVANLDVDMVGDRLNSGPGVVHILVGSEGGKRTVSPSWLVHAVLQGAETSGFPVVVLDRRWSSFAQLAVRCAVPTLLSDGRRFLESGVPSVTVSDLPMTEPRGHHSGPGGHAATVDEVRLRAWTHFLAATTRRLGALAGPPTWETEYLVLGSRVWIRRDLVWAGFFLWILLVWRGLPGSWRQRDSGDRRRMGRSYLPGLAFRMLFLVAVFLVPTFATILLYPVGTIALLGKARRPTIQQLLCFLAFLPTLAFAVWLTIGQIRGWFVLDRAGLLPATMVMLTLATFCAWQLDSTPTRSHT